MRMDEKSKKWKNSKDARSAARTQFTLVCVTMKATFMVIWDASTNKIRGVGFLMTCITKDEANVSFARMETIKAWVAHCLTRQRMLSKHGTNATKRTEYGAGTQAENVNDSSAGTRSCYGRVDRRGIWSVHPQLCTVC